MLSVTNSGWNFSGIIFSFSSKESHILLTLHATSSFYIYKKNLLLLQKVLASHGASKVSAYVTHAVFPKQSYENFMASNSGNLAVHSTQQFPNFSSSCLLCVGRSWARRPARLLLDHGLMPAHNKSHRAKTSV